jgi:hypothetical protein
MNSGLCSCAKSLRLHCCYFYRSHKMNLASSLLKPFNLANYARIR